MKKKEKSYIIIFDKHKNFKEIRVLSESSDPFVVNPKSVGDSIYIYTQKEFAKLIESAMRHIAEPVGEANDSHADDNNIFDKRQDLTRKMTSYFFSDFGPQEPKNHTQASRLFSQKRKSRIYQVQ